MRPSLLTWLCTSLSAGLPRWSFLALTTLVLQARLAPFPRLPILGAFHALFLSQARRLEICNILPGNCASVCSRSGIGMFWTLLRVIVWVICASHGTCGVAAVFCATFISSLNSSSSPRQEVSRIAAFHQGQFSCRTREAHSACFRTDLTHASCN